LKIFLSWSGNRSKDVAHLFRDWLSCALQAIKPWLSSKDIDRGAQWLAAVNDQLKDSTTGIVFLTHENKERPWILFEAGALTKGLTTARVCTFLVDLQPEDIQEPLAQFNHTIPTREGVFQLVESLNKGLENRKLANETLALVFDKYWPEFEQKFSQILEATNTDAPIEHRSIEDLLSEILQNTRGLRNMILQARGPRNLSELTELDFDLLRIESNQAKVMMFDGLSLKTVAEKFLAAGYPQSTVEHLIQKIEKDAGSLKEKN
jgi:TIR domain